jgi:hypothetical protein
MPRHAAHAGARKNTTVTGAYAPRFHYGILPNQRRELSSVVTILFQILVACYPGRLTVARHQDILSWPWTWTWTSTWTWTTQERRAIR